nr:hypothetical protein [Neobacillus bataviensis]
MIDKDNPIKVTICILSILYNFNGKTRPKGRNNRIFPPTLIKNPGDNGFPKDLNGIKLKPPLPIPMPKDEFGNIV